MYRKAKQAPEHKREACLIKELEDMLQKEGLSKNPSEKGAFSCLIGYLGKLLFYVSFCFLLNCVMYRDQ